MRKTKEDTEISKLRILMAAEDEFCQKGYAAANIDSIAKSMGMTKGAIFWHYKNKLNLFKAVVSRAIDKLKEMNRETFDSSNSMPVMERCREILKKLTTNNKAFDVILIMADAEANGEIPKKDYNEFNQDIYRIFHASLNSFDEAKERGELRNDTNNLAILLTVNVVLTGFAKIKKLKTLSVPISEHVDNETIINMIFNGLLSLQTKK